MKPTGRAESLAVKSLAVDACRHRDYKRRSAGRRGSRGGGIFVKTSGMSGTAPRCRRAA